MLDIIPIDILNIIVGDYCDFTSQINLFLICKNINRVLLENETFVERIEEIFGEDNHPTNFGDISRLTNKGKNQTMIKCLCRRFWSSKSFSEAIVHSLVRFELIQQAKDYIFYYTEKRENKPDSQLLCNNVNDLYDIFMKSKILISYQKISLLSVHPHTKLGLFYIVSNVENYPKKEWESVRSSWWKHWKEHFVVYLYWFNRWDELKRLINDLPDMWTGKFLRDVFNLITKSPSDMYYWKYTSEEERLKFVCCLLNNVSDAANLLFLNSDSELVMNFLVSKMDDDKGFERLWDMRNTHKEIASTILNIICQFIKRKQLGFEHVLSHIIDSSCSNKKMFTGFVEFLIGYYDLPPKGWLMLIADNNSPPMDASFRCAVLKSKQIKSKSNDVINCIIEIVKMLKLNDSDKKDLSRYKKILARVYSFNELDFMKRLMKEKMLNEVTFPFYIDESSKVVVKYLFSFYHSNISKN